MSYPPESQIYGVPPHQHPSPQRSKTPWIIGIVAGIGTVAALFCCGGGVLLMRFGLEVMSTEVQDELATRPEFIENIGEIQSFTVNWVRSGAHDDENVFVYDVDGSLGSGHVRVEQTTADDGTENIISAELTMSDGRRIPIDLTR